MGLYGLTNGVQVFRISMAIVSDSCMDTSEPEPIRFSSFMNTNFGIMRTRREAGQTVAGFLITTYTT